MWYISQNYVGALNLYFELSIFNFNFNSGGYPVYFFKSIITKPVKTKFSS